MAVDGLGGQVIGADRSPHAAALAADLDQLGLQVRPENVLQVRNALLGEAVRLGDAVSRYGRHLEVGACGTDPVSKPAMDGFNRKIAGLKADLQGYIDALAAAARVLEQSARAYGHTEAEIRTSFERYAESKSEQWQQQLARRNKVQTLPTTLRPLIEPAAEVSRAPNATDVLFRGGR